MAHLLLDFKAMPTPLNIVIAEPEALERNKIENALGSFRQGYSEMGRAVDLTRDGTQLIRHCLRRNADLVIFDLDIGPMEGLDLIGILKEIDGDTLICPMTSGDSSDQEFKVRTMGIYYYMLKPVSRSEVCSVVQSAIRERERNSKRKEERS